MKKKNPRRCPNPLLFAGMILEGGTPGYDTNVETGGNGARYPGIGTTTQHLRDSVVVSIESPKHNP